MIYPRYYNRYLIVENTMLIQNYCKNLGLCFSIFGLHGVQTSPSPYLYEMQ